MSSADIKGFFRQKKGGISKKSSSSNKNSSKKTPKSPSLISNAKFDLKVDHGDDEEKLRQFDMEMRYGPCVGISRIERWERACNMGLNPTAEIGDILRGFSGLDSKLECLWDGRV